MPFLDWDSKHQAKESTQNAPCHLLKQESVHGAGGGVNADGLLGGAIELPGFSVVETVSSFEIDVRGKKALYRPIDAQQLRINEVAGAVTEHDLVSWLDVELRQPDIGPEAMQAYLLKITQHLQHDRGLSLTTLIRARFQLSQALAREIQRKREAAIVHGFRARLPDMAIAPALLREQLSFKIQAGQYPASNIYQGGFEFSKHFYPVIHDLKEITPAGQVSEEFLCAQAIDSCAQVKFWVRNIERQEKFSFWLPTASDYFYPDFIAELVDGRLLAVEYKGEPYRTNDDLDDSQEKQMVARQWERSSGGRCLFLFAVDRDEQGRDVFKQIANKVQA